MDYFQIDVPTTSTATYLVKAKSHSAAFSKLHHEITRSKPVHFQDGLKLMGQKDIRVNKDVTTWEEVPRSCATCGQEIA